MGGYGGYMAGGAAPGIQNAGRAIGNALIQHHLQQIQAPFIAAQLKHQKLQNDLLAMTMKNLQAKNDLFQSLGQPGGSSSSSPNMMVPLGQQEGVPAGAPLPDGPPNRPGANPPGAPLPFGPPNRPISLPGNPSNIGPAKKNQNASMSPDAQWALSQDPNRLMMASTVDPKIGSVLLNRYKKGLTEAATSFSSQWDKALSKMPHLDEPTLMQAQGKFLEQVPMSIRPYVQKSISSDSQKYLAGVQRDEGLALRKQGRGGIFGNLNKVFTPEVQKDLQALEAAGFNPHLTSFSAQVMAPLYSGAIQKIMKDSNLTREQAVQKFLANQRSVQSLMVGAKGLGSIIPKIQASMKGVEKTIALAKKSMDKIRSRLSGTPYMNTPLIELEKNFKGDPDFREFDTRRSTIMQELAKALMSNGISGTAPTDAARKEIDNIFPPNMTPAQFDRVVKVSEADMAARLAGYAQTYMEYTGKSLPGVPAPSQSQGSPSSGSGGGSNSNKIWDYNNGNLIPAKE